VFILRYAVAALVPVFILSVLTSACGSSGGDGAGAGGKGTTTGGAATASGGSVTGTGGSLGGAAGSPNCGADQDCECEPGVYGTASCVDGISECHCNDCPPYQPTSNDMPDPFEACGGEPFGAWRLKSHDDRGVTFSVRERMVVLGQTYTVPVSCDAELNTTWDDGVPYLFVLEDGGKGSARVPAGNLHARFRDGCACDHIEDVAGDCKFNSECGLCECDELSGGLTIYEGVWTRDSSSFNLNGGGSVGEFGGDYCVTGDTLRLGRRLTFEKVTLIGTPLECSSRNIKRCDGAGCHSGKCVGTDKCNGAATSSECGTRQGCTWDVTQCDGETEAACEVDDWGLVDGCEIVTGPVHCTGKAPECGELDYSTCKKSEGCSIGVCIGDPVYDDCSAFVPPACATQAAGCEDPTDDSGYCVGTFACSAFNGSEDNCLAVDGCDWDSLGCKGTATPCEGLAETECKALPYCAVVPGAK
jgi:hypothetical protein